MATENALWGEERIANELLLKLAIRVSPRTVGKYMPKRPLGRPRGDQRWSTFLRSHAKAMVACDFVVVDSRRNRQLPWAFLTKYAHWRVDRARAACSAHNLACQPAGAASGQCGLDARSRRCRTSTNEG